MARKAKEEAQRKIGNCTKRRNVSTTPSKQNTRAIGTKNNVVSKTQPQSEKIPLKNLSIRLERLDSKMIEELISSPTKPFAVVEKIFKKDKETDMKDVYDYTFDNDAIPLDTENAMKDLYDKMAKENRIEVKKYRAKNAKKQPEKKGVVNKGKTQKRRRDKQPAEIEPPRKKLNLQNKKVNSSNIAASPTAMKIRSNIATVEKNNNLKNAADAEKCAMEKMNVGNLVQEEPSTNNRNVSLNEKSGEAFARLKLRNRIQPNSQSTPKTSTPLNTKTIQISNFTDESPVPTSIHGNTRGLLKQRLELSIAEERIEVDRATPMEENDSAQYFDDDDFPIPSVSPNQDKENTLTVQGMSAVSGKSNKSKDSDDNSRVFSPTKRHAYGRSPLKNITIEVNNAEVSFYSVRSNQLNRDSFGLLNEPFSIQSSVKSNMAIDSTKTKSASRNQNRTNENEPQPSTSKGFVEPHSIRSSLASNMSANSVETQSTTRNPNRSNENEPQPSTSKGLTDSSRIFSPTKRRVYGRSPLKNITSDGNNTHPTMVSDRSNSYNVDIGSMSSLNSVHSSRSINVSGNPKKTQQLTLPESPFSRDRRQSPVQIHFETSQDINLDNCFGFDDDDDVPAEECATAIVSEKPKDVEKPIVPTVGLKNVREKLKRFLHSKDSEATATKQLKSSDNTEPKVANKHKKIKSPAKKNPKTIFADSNAKKQKDIRSALTAQASEKETSNKSKENITAPLFEEFETMQDRRKSYIRPTKQYRKRHISIDSDPEEISDDEDEELVENGKKSKAKRRKKLVDSEPKENVELEEYAKQINEHFAEIDDFPLVVEKD